MSADCHSACSSYQSSPEVARIIREHGETAEALIPVLHETQKQLGYLTEDAMKQIADELKTPYSKVYGVATFYTLFAVKPKGRYVIRLCESAPCHLNDAGQILDTIQEELGIKAGETTPDGKFSLEFTSCLGVCGVAPAIMINDTVYGNLNTEKIKEVLRGYQD